MMKCSLDPRARIIIVFVLNTILFTAQSQFIFIYNNILLVLLFLFSKKIKAGWGVATILTTLITLQHFSGYITNENTKIALQLLFFLFTKVSAIVITGYWITITTNVGSFISAMQSIKLPRGLIITLSVVFRFLPSVNQENWYIKSTMKLRGISPSIGRVIRHPVQTIEYSLVPLIMRSMSIGNRLSAAAITRGLDLENSRTSYTVVKFRMSDGIICMLIVVISVSSYYWEGIVGGLL